MSQSFWVAPDIESICLEQLAPLSQCSPGGFMYLALLTQLFGSYNNIRSSFPPENPYRFDYVSKISNFDSDIIHSLRGSALGQIKHETIGPVRLNPAIGLDEFGSRSGESDFTKHAGSYLTKSFDEGHQRKPFVSFGNNFGNSYSGQYNHFAHLSNANPFVDFNILNRRSSVDAFAADSKKVEVEKSNESDKKLKRKKRQAEEYDFIIVGAGSAGCVLANRLSEVKKWKILLIEAGSEEPDVTSVPGLASVLAKSSIDWMYNTQPEELTCRALRGQVCPWLRGKTMGGSSAINYMVYMRGNKRDYDGWAELGNVGWSFREVLPYFKKSENNRNLESHDHLFHSVGGPLSVERFVYVDKPSALIVEGFKQLGLPVTDFNGNQQFGTDIVQSTSIHGRRFSVNVGFIRPIQHKRHNLHIIKNALVTKILIDSVTKSAYGVNYLKDGVFFSAYAKKEVISSAGAINSPKLLMLSGIGPKPHLDRIQIPVIKDLKVGYNLQDHVTTGALIISLSNTTSTLRNIEEINEEIYDYYKQPEKKHGPLATSSTINAVAFIKTKFALENAPDIQFHFDGRNVREFYSDPSTYLSTNTFPLPFYDGLSARPLLLTPKSRGFILLNETDPIFGPPLIYSRFFTQRQDLDTLIEGMQYAIGLEETEVFKLSGAKYVRVPVPGCTQHIWGTYDYFACIATHYTSTIYHPVGTCKMGPQFDKDAVVDPKLRVYGIHKLRVIDSSIMPVIVRGNTNAPTIMIAEKAADLIKQEWFQKSNSFK